MSTSRGHKDCPRCVTRRIRCDRGLPACAKCCGRNLECPGYGLILKWGQGVASRGKLKGLGCPVQDAKPLPSAPEIPDYAISNTSVSPNGPEIWERDLLAIPASLTVVPSILDDPGSMYIQPLLHHYIHILTPNLSWVEFTENPWRTVLLPLSKGSPALLCALLALAAEDLAAISPSHALATAKVKGSRLSRWYRDRAIQLVTANFAEVQVGTAGEFAGTQLKDSTLAAVLILCNMGIREPGATPWRIHLQAARAWIRRFSTTSHLPSPTCKAETFLIHEFFCINVFASTTTFNDSNDMLEDILANDGETIFIEFLRVVHRVTAIERQQFKSGGATPQHNYSESVLPDVLAECLRARDRTLEFSRTMTLESSNIESDFVSLITTFYYSTLIYSWRVLTNDYTVNNIVQSWCTVIFEQVRRLKDLRAVAQVLIWPLFIAGTECSRDPARMLFVREKIREIIQVSRQFYRQEVIDFLEQFWRHNTSGTLSWIAFARSQASLDSNFIAY